MKSLHIHIIFKLLACIARRMVVSDSLKNQRLSVNSHTCVEFVPWQLVLLQLFGYQHQIVVEVVEMVWSVYDNVEQLSSRMCWDSWAESRCSVNNCFYSTNTKLEYNQLELHKFGRGHHLCCFMESEFILSTGSWTVGPCHCCKLE